MADFPTSVTTNVDPTSGNFVTNPDHAGQHQSHNAEIKATQTKVGTGASTPASNTFLIGTGSGTSSWTAITSAQLAARVTDETGSGVVVFGTAPTLSSPAITTPSITTSINDSSGNEVIKTPATVSATNEITVTNAANGNAPVISATGSSDANVNLNMQPKGTSGIVQVLDGNGNEVIKAGVATASAVNELTITNAATAGAPTIAATGNDSNISINITPKGTGRVAIAGAGAGTTATVLTLETTTSTSFADLATTTDTVTVTIGSSGLALVIITSELTNSAANSTRVSFAASGANTIAASDTRCLVNQSTNDEAKTWSYVATGLTAGSTVFKLKYRVSGGTGTFLNRYISVVPL